MFDRTVIRQSRTEHVPYTKTIIEKKAPTDESIRIYDEMRQKAHDSVLLTLELKDNAFSVVAVVERRMDMFALSCFYKFSLNGQEFSDSFDIDKDLFKDKDYNKFLEKLIASVSEKVSYIISELIARDLMKIRLLDRLS